MRRYIAIALSSILGLQAPLFMASSASAAPAVRVGFQPQDAVGTVVGTVQNTEGRVLSKHIVQLRNIDTGELAGRTTSSARGGFTFTGVPAGNYAVELVDQAGAIVGTSSATAVSGGAISSLTVAATTAAVQGTTAAAGGAAAAGGMGTGLTTALVVTGIAAAAGVAGVVVVARNPSPSN
jgi:hypothetical protein